MRRALCIAIACAEFVGTVSIGLIVWLVVACCWAAWLFVAAIREGLPRAAAVWKARVGTLGGVPPNVAPDSGKNLCSLSVSAKADSSSSRFEPWVN